jgi:hypothetical protein
MTNETFRAFEKVQGLRQMHPGTYSMETVCRAWLSCLAAQEAAGIPANPEQKRIKEEDLAFLAGPDAYAAFRRDHAT